MSTFTPYVQGTSTPADIVNAMSAGVTGVTINTNSILFVGSHDQVSFYDGSLSGLGIGPGLLLTSGDGTPSTSNTSNTYGQSIGGNGDADLDSILTAAGKNATSRDAASLTFTFEVTDPAVNSISFNILFGSDEYPEFVDSNYVDAAGVLVNGINYALFNNFPDQPLSVLQKNLLAGNFINNNNGELPIEYDGVSIPLSITAPVKQGTNTIKIVVGDTGDSSYDSGLFLSNFRASNLKTGGGIVIPPPNQAPVASVVTLPNGVEDTRLEITAAQLLAGTSDVDGDTRSISALSIASGGGALANNGDGTWSYTPAANASGAVTFSYTVTDGELSASSTANLTINPVNDPPAGLALLGSTVIENTTAGITIGTLSSTDVDAGDTHTYTLVNDAGGLFAIGGSSLVVAGAIDFEQAPSHTVTVRSTDQSGAFIDQVFTIGVQDVSPEVAGGTDKDDTILGGDGADNLSGGAGNDLLDGGAGNDTLEGGAGNDTVRGGAGNDRIIAGHGEGNDNYDGGDGSRDTATFTSTDEGITVSLSMGQAQGKEIGRDTLKNIEDIVGGAGLDRITGNAKDNRIWGGSGNSRDVLIGEAGKDKLYGEGGNDVLTGGSSRDTLTGGSGSDRFDFNSLKDTLVGSTKRDVITDFKRGVDKIDLIGIDANENSRGNQGFTWVNKNDLDAAFTGEARELRLVGKVLMGDTDGDRRADFEIQLNVALKASDVWM